MTTRRPHWAAHLTVIEATHLARSWCAGRTIAGHSAFAHATRVARTINRYLPANPELTAAAFLHDSPEYAPLGLDLDAILAQRLVPEVPRIIRAHEAEHEALARDRQPTAPTADLPVLQLSAADKIVSLSTAIRNATTAPDAAAYWAGRRAFLEQLDYLAVFQHQVAGHLPQAMVQILGALITRATEVSTLNASPTGTCTPRVSPEAL